MTLLKLLAGFLGLALLLVPALSAAMIAHVLFPGLVEIVFLLVLLGTLMLMGHLRM